MAKPVKPARQKAAKALEARFADAKAGVEKLLRRPSNDDLLALYSLYKQATEGDISGTRPGLLDLRGRAKHDAWAGRRGLSKDEAMQAYVELVAELEAEFE